MSNVAADLGGAGAVVRLASPVTHSDWMVRDPAPAWGTEGVHQILDRCKECGWSRVYWRCFDGGRALYMSELMEPYHAYDEDNYHVTHGSTWVLEKLKPCDYRTFDSLKEAVEYGHKIGLEVHAWLSINEDDHAWGLISRFAKEHPEYCWVRRDGSRYCSQLSFAFKEVREYKLGLVEEILQYNPDGIFFDWIRTGDIRDNPQTDPEGVANHGYEAPNLQRFNELHGLDVQEVANNDERWVQMRAEPQTTFMREANALIKRTSGRMIVSAMVQHPWSYRGGPTDTPYADNLRGLLVDVRAWSREKLIDEVVAAGYYREGGSPEEVYRWMRQEVEDRIPVWLYGWIQTKEQFLFDVELAARLDAPQLLLWESDYIGLPPENAETVDAMREQAHVR